MQQASERSGQPGESASKLSELDIEDSGLRLKVSKKNFMVSIKGNLPKLAAFTKRKNPGLFKFQRTKQRSRGCSLPSSLGPRIGDPVDFVNRSPSDVSGFTDTSTESDSQEENKIKQSLYVARGVVRNSLKEANRRLFSLGGFKLTTKTMKEVNKGLEKMLELGQEFAERFEHSEKDLDEIKHKVKVVQKNVIDQETDFVNRLEHLTTIVQTTCQRLEENQTQMHNFKVKDDVRNLQWITVLLGLFVCVIISSYEDNVKICIVICLCFTSAMFGEKYLETKYQHNTKLVFEQKTRERFESIYSTYEPPIETPVAEAVDFKDTLNKSVFANQNQRVLGINHLEDTNLSFDTLVYDTLNEDQKLTFDLFKHSSFRPEYETPDHFTLIRFLQADRYDVSVAKKRLASTLKWRQDSGLKALLDAKTPPPGFERYKQLRPRRMLGEDVLNRPIIYEKTAEFFGHSDVPNGFTKQEWLLCYAWEMAELFGVFREVSVKYNEYVHNFVFIADLKGARASYVKKVSLVTMLKNEVEVHFPEVVGEIHLINAPWFLAQVWKVIKAVLDPVVVGKIHIHKGVPEKFFKEHLRPDFSLD